MIDVREMSYCYEKEHPALRDINLCEREPVITILWGRNGAGKSTLMKVLAGHIQPQWGEVKVFGQAPYNNPRALEKICYMQEDHPFSILWTADTLFLFCAYYNPGWNRAYADQLLKQFGIDGGKRISKYSKGMKSALFFIVGISSHARVTILDEPASSLDAGMRQLMYKTIRESYEEDPRLIILSTHHIEEMQPIGESLIVLNNGQLLMHEKIEVIREKGVWLSGSMTNLEIALAKETILQKQEVGSMAKVLVDAPFSSEWKKQSQDNELAIEKAKMQDYLLYLTSKVGVSK